MIQKNSVVVDKDIVNVLVLFVGDFNVVYALTRGLGACSTHTCTYCATPLVHIYKSCSDLKTVIAPGGEFSSGKLHLRPKMLD